jgi:hypothetical protein
MLLLPWKYATTCFPFRSTQKCSTPTLGVRNQNIFLSLHSLAPVINAPVFLLLSLKILLQKEAWVVLKKEKDKKGLVSKIKEKKKEKKRRVQEQPKFSQKFPISKREVCFQGARVKLCFPFKLPPCFHQFHYVFIPLPPYIHSIYIGPHTCTSWFDYMPRFSGSMVWLCNICWASMYRLSPHL